MDKLAIVLALAALGLGGYALSQGGDKDAQIDALAHANGDLRDQIIALEARLEGELGATPAGPLLQAEGGTSGDATGARAAGGSDAPGGLATRKPATPMERLAQLEKRVADQDAELASLREKEAAAPQTRRTMPTNYYGNVDMAAKDLGLDERQQADMKDVADRAQRELEDLFNIENDNGETWNQIRKPKTVEGGGFTLALPDMAKIRKFREGRIPGSSETFGQAEDRIRKDAFGRMRNLLTPEQTKKWDKAHKEPLLRGGERNAVVFSSIVLDGADK